jgi:short subunit dehydrogenase-like uncharacterized protein
LDAAVISVLILAINGVIGFGMAWIAYKQKALDSLASRISEKQDTMTHKVAQLEENTNNKMDKLIESKEAESTAKQHAAGLEGELRGRDQSSGVAAVVTPAIVIGTAAPIELSAQDIAEFETLIARMKSRVKPPVV